MFEKLKEKLGRGFKSGGFRLLITGNQDIEKALKILCEENKEKLLKYGFDLYYTKVDLDRYNFFCITTSYGAGMGMSVAKGILLKEIDDRFKKIDPSCTITEVTEVKDATN
jgi:hypothetical protein